MFGAICAGLPVQTNLQTLSESQYAFSIPLPQTQRVNHIVIFLLPGAQLPPDTAAGVYIRLASESQFRFLGAVAMDKQSAIFRITSGSGGGGPGGGEIAMTDEGVDGVTGGEIMLGISIEPTASIAAQLSTLRTSAAASTSTALVPVRQKGGAPPNTKLLAQRIIKNAFNFLASFAQPSPQGDLVPIAKFQEWWTKFEKKVEMDEGFLLNET